MLRRRRSLYERLLDEKDVRIADLQAQLDQSYIALGKVAPSVMRIPSHTLVDGEPAVSGSATWESELEEAEAILDSTGLSRVHLNEILDGLGYSNSDLS